MAASAPEPGLRTICLVLHSLEVGGTQKVAVRLVRQLRGQFRFVAACLDGAGSLSDELRADGVPVRVLGRRPGIDPRAMWRLARLLRQEHVDLVHAHQYAPFFYSVAARLAYRRPPILFTEHGRLVPERPRRKRMVYNRLLLERRDRVVGVSRAVRQALVDYEGIREERVAVIHNGIDTRSLVEGTPHRDEIRAEIGVGKDDLLILQVARLDPMKDHATALRALERVVRHRPNTRLVLAGEGPEQARIEEIARDRQLTLHLRALGLRKDVQRLMRAADFFLLTSLSEGFPLAILEAMAAGLPVVATNVGGVPEIVEDGVTGLLAPRGDDASLAASLVWLAESPELARQMGRRGRERAVERFSEGEMHAHYARLYREMLPR